LSDERVGDPGPIPRAAIVAVGALAAVVVVLVGLSLRKPKLPEFAPTAVGAAAPLGPGPHLLTVDASNAERWLRVDLARGTVVDDPYAPWDLAFRRFEVRLNGGPGFAGQAGALELGTMPLDSVHALPLDGYRGMEVSGRDTTVAVLEHWYAYSYTTHVLQPLDRTYALRTADGRRLALRFESYYCPGAQPGCVTLRYRFFDDGPSS
jgi:hypothetical protein